MQVKDAFRATMAKAKLYTSGNGNVISTVRMQTVEQRASRLTPRHLPSFRATVKHVKTAKFYNSTHDCPHFQSLREGYSQILRMSLNHILYDSELNQTVKIVHVAIVKRGFCFYNIACGPEECNHFTDQRGALKLLVWLKRAGEGGSPQT